MKTFVITLSSVFPTTHPSAGKETFFWNKLTMAFKGKETATILSSKRGTITLNGGKFHTIRTNYPLWEKRISQVQNGEAVLSIRQWSGKPYRSKQNEIARLTAEDGVGIQELRLTDLSKPTTINGERVELHALAKNDGLSFSDWFNWFKGCDLSKPFAIIHFTKFRYGND